MDIEVVLEGTEFTIRVFISQPVKKLLELLLVNTLLESHVQINTLWDWDGKYDCNRFDLVHPVIDFKWTVLEHPSTILVGLGCDHELVKVDHFVSLLNHLSIRWFERDDALLYLLSRLIIHDFGQSEFILLDAEFPVDPSQLVQRHNLGIKAPVEDRYPLIERFACKEPEFIFIGQPFHLQLGWDKLSRIDWQRW